MGKVVHLFSKDEKKDCEKMDVSNFRNEIVKPALIMTGNAIISNTHASNTGESFIKFTTEVNTSAVSLQAKQVSQICGRVYLEVIELE